MKFRVGILGGTFDPPHIGHLILAEEARTQFQLDRIYFIPAYLPPHKTARGVLDARHRLAMVKLAIKGNEAFRVFDGEIRRKGVSFTVDTLRELKAMEPAARLFLLMGQDNLPEFMSWREPTSILRLATLVVYGRDGSESAHRAGRVPHKRLRTPLLNISSTEIRKRVAAGASVKYWIASPVESYIKRHKLYRRHTL